MEPNRAGCVSFPREWTRFYLLGLSVLLLFVFTGRTAFAAGERLALVIGNSNYAALSSLKNPHNDERSCSPSG